MASKMKTAEIREENNGTRIRTKKFYFTGGEQVKMPPPTIPGVVSMSKQEKTPVGKNNKKTVKAKQTDKPTENKGKTKHTSASVVSGRKKKVSQNTSERTKVTASPKQSIAVEKSASKGDIMQGRKKRSVKGPSEKRRHGRQNRQKYSAEREETELRTCRFMYSGSGYGFAEPRDGAEDIFISHRNTMNAMTGDTVQVRVTVPGNHGRQSPEGEVVSILEHNVSSVIGTLVQDKDGVFYVKPNNEKLRTPVYVPAKDAETLGIGSGTKVEVVPEGKPYFIRSQKVTVQRYAGGKRNARGRRQEKNENTPFYELMGRISAVFGDAATKEANYAAILHESGIRTEFPPHVIQAAENAAEEVLTNTGRRDNRNRIIFTIDGAGAKDLDDAISLEKTDTGYVLGVHIADVAHYAPFGSSVEKEARLRGTSVYFTDKVVPMLPRALSNHACSLNADSDKYAVSCEITLDHAGNRTHTVIYKSRIQSAVRGVYEEVNDVFEKGKNSAFYEKYSHVADVLTDMKELYLLLAARSEERGVMELESPEPEILLDETGFPVSIRSRTRGDAEKMIEQFMLQANMAVAELLKKLGLPCLYRIHDEPQEEKIGAFAVFAHNLGLSTYNLAESPSLAEGKRTLSDKLVSVLAQAKEKGIGDIVSSVLLRSMMKAKYVSVCSPHFGLGVPVYCHFTSPIRRYPDLFVHNVLSAVLPYTDNGELTAETKLPPEAYPKQLDAECAPCGIASTEAEINAQNAEWKIEDLYMALYMSAHIGEIFDVTVDSIIKQGIFVRCDNLAEGMLPASMIPDARIHVSQYTFVWRGKTYTLGSRMRLKLIEADAASGKITFAPEI